MVGRRAEHLPNLSCSRTSTRRVSSSQVRMKFHLDQERIDEKLTHYQMCRTVYHTGEIKKKNKVVYTHKSAKHCVDFAVMLH